MWPNPQIPAEFVTFTEEMLKENFSFVQRVYNMNEIRYP